MSEEQSTVTYRDIPGFPGYRVGDDGSVWSCKTRGKRSHNGGQWRPLKPGTTKSGYKLVSLSDKNRHLHMRYIHILVLETFTCIKPEKMEVRHKDNNPANNQLSNLHWGTHLENMIDMVISGNSSAGERNGNHKLTDSQVKEIRLIYNQGYSLTSIADVYVVSQTTIHNIVNNKSWKHVQ